MGKQCRIRVPADRAQLVTLEGFISACPLLSGRERDKAIIVATECFDNIVTHGRCAPRSLVTVRVTSGDETVIDLAYAIKAFDRVVASHNPVRPYYDPETRRYRGLGLLRCKNLTKKRSYRKGLFKGRIRIIL
jgi:anti-sigma regulatory factor (Ser/Thr protein kinase)